MQTCLLVFWQCVFYYSDLATYRFDASLALPSAVDQIDSGEVVVAPL